MAETKYGKYFVRGPKPGATMFKTALAYLDDSIIKGSQYFYINYTQAGQTIPSHGPHVHDYPEILGWFGINPDDPYDLGGECTLYMGEEMERHDFNQSTLVYIPAGLVHCPIVYRKIERPYIFLYTMFNPTLQETSRKDLLPLVPEEDRAKVFFPHG